MTFTKLSLKKLALVLLACAFSGASLAAGNAGFVYVSPIGDAGWSYETPLAAVAPICATTMSPTSSVGCAPVLTPCRRPERSRSATAPSMVAEAAFSPR